MVFLAAYNSTWIDKKPYFSPGALGGVDRYVRRVARDLGFSVCDKDNTMLVIVFHL